MRELARALPPELVPIVQRFRDAALSTSTRTAYLSALRSWVTWCLSFTPALSPWPPSVELVEGYLADLARRGYSLATIQLAMAALGEATRLAALAPGADDAARALAGWRRELSHHLDDKGTLEGIRRTLGTAPKRKARPLLTAELAECLRTLPHSSAGVRDRALLVVGWSCALRSADLAALERRDVRAYGAGFLLHIRRSKTDQAGAGEDLRVACIPGEVCTACALRAWLEVRGELPGPLFGISKRLVSRVVKHAARRLGLDPAEFSSHSLRAGGITSWDNAGVPESAIGRVSRHRSEKQLRGYIRGAQLLREPTPAELTLERFQREKPP
jgi:integrase